MHRVLQAHIGPWLGLLVTQPGVALSNDAMLVVKHSRSATSADGEDDPDDTSAGGGAAGSAQAQPKRRKKHNVRDDAETGVPQVQRPPPAKALVGGASQETSPDPEAVLAARASAARSLGVALAACESAGSPVGNAVTALLELLTIEPGVPKLALRRVCGGLVAGEWAAAPRAAALPPTVHSRLVVMLTDATASDVSFAELNGLVQRLRGQVGASSCCYRTLTLNCLAQRGTCFLYTYFTSRRFTCTRSRSLSYRLSDMHIVLAITKQNVLLPV